MNSLLQQFSQGIDTVIPETYMDKLVSSEKPLRIKWGVDPSAPDIHFGHMVILNKLRLLQEMGHIVVFLIGDFTAMIGDPTGKSETRKQITKDVVQQNTETYIEQVFKILDKANTEIVYNSHWLSTLNAEDITKLAAKYTVARMLERDDFSKRFKGEQPISIHEFLYPLFQGYDSVVLKNDIEIGGTDQTFNLLMGRHLQKESEQKPQAIITLPILEGLDGKQKMSKSLNNHIGLLDEPKEMFGKLMSIPDELISRYYQLLTTTSPEDIDSIITKMKNGDLNPKIAKENLALILVERLHSKKDAEFAKEEFARVFSHKQNPEQVNELTVPSGETRLDDLLTQTKLIGSKKEVVRLIKQGAILIDDQKINEIFYSFTPKNGQLLRIGRKRFYKLVTP